MWLTESSGNLIFDFFLWNRRKSRFLTYPTLVGRAENRIRRTEHALMYWPTNLRGRENHLYMCPGPNGKTANITLKSVYKLQMCSRHNKTITKFVSTLLPAQIMQISYGILLQIRHRPSFCKGQGSSLHVSKSITSAAG